MFLEPRGWLTLIGFDLRDPGRVEEVAGCLVGLGVLLRGRPLALTLAGERKERRIRKCLAL